MLTLPLSCLPATRCRFAACLALLLFIAAVPGVSRAVEVTSLYSAEVPLDSSARDPRPVAYRDALEAVLLRVSGSDLANDPERVDLLFPNPASYVVQFQPGEEDTLWVTFDGNAIEEVLRSNGQTVWGRERPLTLVWLAVDWGQGEREIVMPTVDGCLNILRSAQAAGVNDAIPSRCTLSNTRSASWSFLR